MGWGADSRLVFRTRAGTLKVISIPQDTVRCFVPGNLDKPLPGAARGMLAGLRFVAKDLFDVVGHRTSNGSPDFHRHALPSKNNAEAISRLLNAGASLIGMTICDEFFYSLTGVNEHYGTPINCRAPGRLPGGSSSGSAAAVAAGLADFSLGSDTGGSVRIPASFCGLWGIRPTIGRVSLKGARAMAPSFDTVGWFANEGSLMARLGEVLLEGDPENTAIKQVFIGMDAIEKSDLSIATATLEWIDTRILEKKIVTISPDGLDNWWETFRVIQAGEVKSTNLPWVREHGASLGPGIRERFLMAESLSQKDLDSARENKKIIVKHLKKLVTPGSALMIPTAPCLAPLLDEDATVLDTFRANTMALTCIAGLGGFPQITVPAVTIDGFPVGISILGSHGSDEQLLNFANDLI